MAARQGRRPLRRRAIPERFLGDLPLIYPFIINDPGEGAQAKRRAHAVIVDHLTPPMTTAEAYGELDELARLVDEYYQVETLDPTKLPMLQQQIWELVVEARLDADINLDDPARSTSRRPHPRLGPAGHRGRHAGHAGRDAARRTSRT